MSTIVYCERCDRIIDRYDDDDQCQEASDICVACDDEETHAEQDEQ